jgi:hypothetical protein
MKRGTFGSIIVFFVVITLSLTLCLLSSCRKSAPKETPKDSTAQQGATKAVEPNTPKPSEPNQTSAKPVEPSNVEMAPIEIELPRAMFVGTPQPAKLPNLEKARETPREPFLAPVGTKNVARGKPVTSSDEMPIIGELSYITDGDKEASEGSYVELGPGLQHVTIDLGAKYEIYAVVVWHYHKQGHVYFDVVVQVADDPDFITGVKTIFNNDIDNSAGLGVGKDMHYVETNEGRLIDAKGVQGRYVRLYSNGNHVTDMNHYIEVEVYGKPVE